MDLTDEQWALVEPLITLPPRHGRGRPPQNTRAILNGILYKLGTGVTWPNLPPRYPSQQTCRRYLQHWQQTGTLNNILSHLTQDLKQRGGFNLQSALRQGDVRILTRGTKPVIEFAPHLQNTWQASLAIILIRLILIKAGQIRKQGRHSSTSIWDAL